MVTFCQDAINRSDEHGSESRMLIQSAFTLLHQTFRREEAVWKCFTKDPRVSDLHALILFHMNPFLAADASTMIENFCMDSTSPPEVADFYMNVVLGIVPRALVYPDRATQFFELGTGLLLHNSILRHDESRARGVTNSLIETLFTYEHAESVDLPIVDRVLSGLLRLLIESITVVRSFKKNLRVEGLATRLFCSLLFPDPSDTHARPLVHVETRRLAYGLARAVCETKQDFMGVLKSLRPALYETHSTPHARYPGVSNWLRPAYMCSGLENLGMTCYMNSLLQQLFANVQFRAFILDTEIVDDERQTLLFQLQALFARMQNSSAPCADTAALARVLDIQTDSQEDVHGFYADFLSRLETNMPDETSKATLRNFFTGKLISQIKGECGHVSPRTEPFVDLPMLVKNKAGLHDSLDEFVQGEPMEGSNQYKCQACDPADGGRLVNAMRRSCPEEMPDNLTFCLKRFTFEAMLGLDGKVNDRFEFPQSIDMSRYCRAHLEDPKAEIKEDHFELVGVIVHQGTLQLGHYWSYTLLRNTGDPYARNWVKLEDKNVSTCSGGIDDVQRECFGGLRYTNGLERADNAYVLFYQRQSSLEAQLSVPGPIVDPSTQIPFPPRVKIPDVHQQPIHHDNAWRRRIANLFHYDLLSMMEWILVHCKRFGFNSSAPSDSSSDNSAESSPQSDVDASESPKVVGEPVMDDLVQLVGEVVFLFIQRVGVCDMTPETKLAPCISGLERLIADQPRLGLVILEHMTRDPFWFQASLLHQSDHVRSTMNKLIWTCLWALSGREKTAHRAMVTRLRQMHAQLLTSESKTLRELNWSDYLGFAAEMAKISPQDTAAILDEGYWEWASDMINLPWDSTIRKKYPGLHDHLKTRPDQFSAVYDFLRSLLEEHVTIPNPEDFTPPDGPHVVTDEGKVLLRLKEVHTFVWPLWQRGTRTVFNWLRSAKYADQDG
jgi:ubiquitin carboxyl-terminal hydrolase 34